MTISVAQSIKDSLTRTRNAVFSRVAGLFGASEVTAATWDELEELLRQSAGIERVRLTGSHAAYGFIINLVKRGLAVDGGLRDLFELTGKYIEALNQNTKEC